MELPGSPLQGGRPPYEGGRLSTSYVWFKRNISMTKVVGGQRRRRRPAFLSSCGGGNCGGYSPDPVYCAVDLIEGIDRFARDDLDVVEL